MNTWTHRRAPVFLLSIAVAGCGGDLTLPSPSGEGVDFAIVDGDDQVGTVGEQLPEPLVVSVQAGGTPVRDYEVAFSIVGDRAGVTLEPDTAVTGVDGRAVAHVVLGPEAGSYQIEATLVVADLQPPPTAIFEASAVAAEPDTLRADSPVTQPGRREEQPPDPPAVLVVDRFGNPVPGAVVRWDVTAGGGAVSGGETADAGGRAVATWTLGDGVGVQKLTARVDGADGSPVTFMAVVLF
jgi:hypothetical protein